jgi:hypothetical protein
MPEFATKTPRTPARARRRSLAMHSSQCTICRHPRRAEIERDFLDWVGCWTIVREYGLTSRNAIYRHAHAFGLFNRRDRGLKRALGRLIEQIEDVKPTAASIVSAIRLMAKLNARAEYSDEAEIDEAEDSTDVAAPESPAPNQHMENRAENGSTNEVVPPAAWTTLVAAREAESGARPNVAPPLRAASAAAKPVPANGKGRAEGKKRGAKDEWNDGPIAFAETAGLRRKLFRLRWPVVNRIWRGD